METSGFVTSLVTSLVVFLVLCLLFPVLSRIPANAVIYYPNRILSGVGLPPNLSLRNPMAWIREAWSATEDDIIAIGGLDATIYIHFLTTSLLIIGIASIFCIPVLLPISGTDHYDQMQELKSNALNLTDFDKVAMGNIKQGSQRLWAFLIGVYWLSISTYFVLWRAYKHVVRLCAQYQATSPLSPQDFTVLVRDIPRQKDGKYFEEVDSFFRKLHPEHYETCLIVTNIRKLLKIWRKLQKFKKNLAHVEVIFKESKESIMISKNPEGSRPTHRTGFLGLVGSKVDSIDFYNEKIKEFTQKLEEEQKITREERQLPAALVFFNNCSAAATAGQTMHGQFANKWTVCPAPEPRDLVWRNLRIPMAERLCRELLVDVIVFVSVCFYMLPITFVSGLISLNNLEKNLPFLKRFVQQKEMTAILQAFLPQLALIVFLFVLPIILVKISKEEGIPSQSQIVRAAAGKYFYFNIFNVFLGVTVAGTLFTSLQGLIDDPKSVISLLSKSLPPQATFFITFVALKFFVGYGLQLTRLFPLIMYHLKRKYQCKTEEELREAWAPGPVSYHTAVPSDMLILTITLCYSIIAPMILPFALVYFSLGWLIARSQVLNVYVAEFDSCGRMWPHMHNRVLAALFVSQLTMIGYFGIKKFNAAPILVPLPFITFLFGYVCKKFFYPAFLVPSLCVAAASDKKEVLSVASMIRAYTPTCLLPTEDSADEFEDSEKFVDARSRLSSKASSSIASPV